jgi:hypothetical protein
MHAEQLCLKQHQVYPILSICLRPDCRSTPTACDACQHEHEGHDMIPLARFKHYLTKFADSQPEAECLKEIPLIENQKM